MFQRKWLLAAGLVVSASLGAPRASGQAMTGAPIAWADATNAECPFPRSTRVKNDLKFTGRWAVVPNSGADTWYPSWASDGAMYSTFADGTVNGVTVQGYQSPGAQSTGHARIDGDDPGSLKITVVGTKLNDPTPYAGRYPSASLAYNGVWYYGTYTLDELDGPCQNWCIQGPFVGFRQSSDGGKTWTDTKYTPSNSLFGESGKNGGKVKFGPVHVVDFGKNMEHSPDGYAYFVSGGAVGANGIANWIGGDAVYLARVKPTPQNMDDRAAFEFYSGAGWSHAVADAQPIVSWPSRMGSVTVTYDAPVRTYLMWVSRPHDINKNRGSFDTMLLEADQITGPWRIVTTLGSFGTQAYFVNVPSKFISADGKTMWLLYSANFSGGNSNPPGSGYNHGMHELTLSIDPPPPVPDAGVAAPDGGKDAGGDRGAATGAGGSGGGGGGSPISGSGGAQVVAGSGGTAAPEEDASSHQVEPSDGMEAVDAGCSCKLGASRAAPGWVAALLVTGAFARRRRRR